MPIDTRSVSLQTAAHRVAFAIRRERFAEYDYAPDTLPGFTSLFAPGERSVVSPAPKTGRALWFAHDNVNGVCFAATEEQNTDVPVGMLETESLTARRGAYSIGFQQVCLWRDAANRLLMTDTRTARALPGSGEGRILDLAIAFQAPADAPVILQRSLSPLLSLHPTAAMIAPDTAQVRNSQGDFGLEALHGRRAGWVSCVGVLDGVTISLALLDHPENPTYPSPWVVRPEGILALSPFGWQRLEIAAGKRVSFRYRLLIHEDYVSAGWVEERLREFALEPDRD